MININSDTLLAAAAKFVPMTDIPFLGGWNPGEEFKGSTTDVFNQLFTLSISIGAMLAVFMFIWGGLQMIVARDKPGAIGAGKKKMEDAIIGLLMLLSTFIILSTINPQLTSLNFLSGVTPINTQVTKDTRIGSGYNTYEWIKTGTDNNGNVKRCDEVNSGFVGVDAHWCGSNYKSNSRCCAYNKTVSRVKNTTIPTSSESTYNQATSIPAGDYCYTITGDSGFYCSNSAEGCYNNASRNSGVKTNCRKYNDQ